MLDLNSPEGAKLLRQMYLVEKKSLGDIARELGTYSNRIRRALMKHGIPRRDKSEATLVALEQGKCLNPTVGKPRTEDEKVRIARKVWENWRDKPEFEKALWQQYGRESWAKKSRRKQQEIHAKSKEALKKASRDGSRLEHYILAGLRTVGFNVLFHEKLAVGDSELEVDLHLPELRVAIEIDGPAHYLPIWGEEKLLKSQENDRLKNGILMEAGWRVVRVKSLVKNASYSHCQAALEELLVYLESPSPGLTFLEAT